MRRSLPAAAVCALALLPLAATALSACTSAPPTHPEGASALGPPPVGDGGTTVTRPLAARESVVVTYCNHQQARITEPDARHGPAPAAVYVHGGAWVSGDMNSGGFIIDTVGPELAAEGFVVASLNYRLGPAVPWPAQIEDVKCAIRYLRANARNLNIAPNDIGAWGQSAGGHLVALLGTAGPSAGWDVGAYQDESSTVQAVVDMAGPSDLLRLENEGASKVVRDSFLSLLRDVPPADADAALRAASPVVYVAPGDPPFLLLHSDNDSIVYLEQSKELAWVLSVNHVPNRLIVFHDTGHSFDQPGGSPPPADIARIIVDFFVQTLVLHAPLGASS